MDDPTPTPAVSGAGGLAPPVGHRPHDISVEHREIKQEGKLWLLIERALSKDVERELSPEEESKEMTAIDALLKGDLRSQRTGANILQARLNRYEQRRKLALDRACNTVIALANQRASLANICNTDAAPQVNVNVGGVQVVPERTKTLDHLRKLAFGEVPEGGNGSGNGSGHEQS